MSGLDHDRPLWQFTVIDGLEGDEAVVIIKFHHVLADGVGLLAIVPLLMDLSPEPRDLGPLPPVPEGGAHDANATWFATHSRPTATA